MKLPAHIQERVDAAQKLGHTLVSQGGGGGGLFRCTTCGKKAFLDGARIFDIRPEVLTVKACVPLKTRFHSWLSAVDSKTI